MSNVESTNTPVIEIIEAESFAEVTMKAGVTVSPSEIDQIPFEVKGWALKIYQFRQNLRLGFGSWRNLTKTQKTLLTLTTGAGAAIGWLTGTWQHIVDLST